MRTLKSPKRNATDLLTERTSSMFDQIELKTMPKDEEGDW